MRRYYAPLAGAFAHGRALLPSGDSPYGLAAPPHTTTWFTGPPMSIVPAGDCHYGWVRCKSPLLRAPHYRRSPLRVAAPCKGLWPQPIAPLQVAKPWPTAPTGDLPWPATLIEGLAMAGHPLFSLLSL
ncbi:hypothetical protein B296_00014890 [Ensete ventricosum]|uniref:Uncharacterized protein n=1 Tax=Ensete ventricosum TaxID=4639 RepID=A0A426XGT4_ENSVE|nr:hypothetical protein B296_00014890 [Ensete ventricosum]